MIPRFNEEFCLRFSEERNHKPQTWTDELLMMLGVVGNYTDFLNWAYSYAIWYSVFWVRLSSEESGNEYDHHNFFLVYLFNDIRNFKPWMNK